MPYANPIQQREATMSLVHILRDDGRYLTGPGSTQTAAEPGAPFESIRAAMRAIADYRLSCAFCAPERKDDGFTLIHVNAIR